MDSKGDSGALAHWSLCVSESFLFWTPSLIKFFCCCILIHICLFSGLCSTNKSATSFFRLSLCTISQELSSLLSTIRLQLVPMHSFLPGNDAFDELVGRGVLLLPCAVHSGFFPRTSSIHFSRTGGVSPQLNSLTHKYHRYPLRNLCFVVTLPVSSLVFTVTNIAFC